MGVTPKLLFTPLITVRITYRTFFFPVSLSLHCYPYGLPSSSLRRTIDVLLWPPALLAPCSQACFTKTGLSGPTSSVSSTYLPSPLIAEALLCLAPRLCVSSLSIFELLFFLTLIWWSPACLLPPLHLRFHTHHFFCRSALSFHSY